ncbi:MAG: CocE/NonD family hydrolase, partial [Rhodospirillales bacterium]|nr:CocE/NonD family hydrolase [Rhodospirillales bacterium]
MSQKKPTIRNYKRSVDNIELAWIPMSDGRRLAARLVLPKNAVKQPVPAILEYIPYRRRDGTRPRDEEVMYWFAANGYASVRLDISGSGDSEGLIEDEYVKREQDDAIEAIAWLAKQDWCSGAVGMIGISWGGFNGLQVAARRPPALKAVISLCSTVDRYNDDAHLMGGCLLNETMDWGSAFFTYGSLPPDPEMVGERKWRAMWRDRLKGLKLYPALWMAHQRRDAFWKHGSVKENFGAIQCPVLAVSGWVDGYTSAVYELVENLNSPCKGIIGPWGHKYPHMGVPGPAIGFLQECKRWWDHWLKDIDTGVDKDPDMRLYLQESKKPAPHFDNREGRWLGIPKWPSAGIKTQTFHFGGDALSSKPAAKSRHTHRTICSPQITGVASGEWCAYGLGKISPELPLDQRQDDSGSMVFDSVPLSTPLSIVGEGSVKLRVASDKPQALVAVRVNGVHPDGTVERISYGLLNLTHRDSHARPSRLKPGVFYDVTVKLKGIAQTVPVGHRLRIAISTSYWPMAWPSPDPATLTIDPAGSHANLPVLRSEKGFKPVKFDPVEYATPLKMTATETGDESRELIHTIDNQTSRFVVTRDDG